MLGSVALYSLCAILLSIAFGDLRDLEKLENYSALGKSDNLDFSQRRSIVEQLQQQDSDWNLEQLKVLASWANGAVVDADYFDKDEVLEAPIAQNAVAMENQWDGPQLASGIPWPGKKVIYSWHPDLNWMAKRVMNYAFREIEGKSCVTFEEVPYDENRDTSYLLIKSDEPGCRASTGYKSEKVRKLNLGFMCEWKGVAIHEILHSLGMAHEQSRADRDYFVEILNENIKEGYENNFEIDPEAYTALGYDYMSIMHYDPYAFSNNFLSGLGDPIIQATLVQLARFGHNIGEPTMKVKNPNFVHKIGQRSKMSNGDLEQLLHMYQCPKLALASEDHVGAGISWRDGIAIKSGYESMDISCSPAFVPTSCSCYQEEGDCRGALFSEGIGGTCWAGGRQGGSTGLKAHIICHKLSSPHYVSTRISAEVSAGSTTVSCGSQYRLVGCGCLSLLGANCDATPSFEITEGRCTAASTGKVVAQATCVRAPAIETIQIINGSLGLASDATCPTGMELTGCSCASVESGKGACAGARPSGTASNTCSAKSSSNNPIRAWALCGQFLSVKNVPLPVAEYFTGGALSTNLSRGGELAPIQSVYCMGVPETPGINGRCAHLTSQRRSKANYDCSSQKCNEVDLVLQAGTVDVSVQASDGQARCPAGWVGVAFNCLEMGCDRVSVTCAAPPSDSTWFPSGGITVTSFFGGDANAAMGTCGQAVAVGIQCANLDADSTFFPDNRCKSMQLLCRRVAIVSTDDEDRRGSFDIRLLNATWSHWVSSTGLKEHTFQLDFEDSATELSNTDVRPIQQAACRGQSCDDIRFYMPERFGTFSQSVDLKGTLSIKSVTFREGEMLCPRGHFLAGLKCEQAWCEKKQITCAAPAGGRWVLTGQPYYSHCFTNNPTFPWLAWFNTFRDAVRGRKRSCLGLASNDMPDTQSCGPDGLLVGLRCYGDECDRLQLVCQTIDANITASDGEVQSALSMELDLMAFGLYDNASTWPDQPHDGQLATSLWDGEKAVAIEDIMAAEASAIQPCFVICMLSVLAWPVGYIT